jgi:hypothetical protein
MAPYQPSEIFVLVLGAPLTYLEILQNLPLEIQIDICRIIFAP